MSDLILQQQTQSPFDSIRHVDEDGEFWSARELMSVLGYDQWRRFADAIDRASISLKANGHKTSDHIAGAGKMAQLGSGAIRRVEDYRLSRLGCYMVAMNGDPRKQEIAAAQSYFAIKTREAETIIPAQNDRIKELELELQLRKAEQKLIDTRHMIVSTCPKPIADRIFGVTVEKEIEYVDRTITPDGEKIDGCGITYLQKRYGFKSTAATWAWLESVGCGKDSGYWQDELVAVHRPALPRGILSKLDDLSQAGNRQRWIGE